MASPSDPPTGRAGDTEQFPVARTDTHAAQPRDAAPTYGPAHAVTTDSGSGITRGGWWAITIAAAVLLILGFLLTFGPARYWTPVPVVFLGYFLISGLIGLVFWKGVRELRDSNPTLHSGDGPASPAARVAAAIGAVGIAAALVLLPAGLTDAPANAAPCPDGTNTCGPQPTMGPQPTQGNGGNTTAPQAPNTTVPGYTPPDTPPQQGSGSTPTVQGQVPTMPTGDTPSNGCIFNCGPTQAPQAPQTGQVNPPQTGQQQNPVTTAPNTPATTPQAPTTTPRMRTPTPDTTTSTSSSKSRDRDDDQQRSSDEDRDKNSPYPYQAAELAAVAGTYRRRKISESAVRSGRAVTDRTTTLLRNSSGPERLVYNAGLRTDRTLLNAFDRPELTPDMLETQERGRSTFNTKSEPSEKLKKVEEILRRWRWIGAYLGGADRAQMLLTHYLDGSGNQFGMPVKHGNALATVPQMQEIRDTAIRDAVREAMSKGMTDGTGVAFDSGWQTVAAPKSNPDLFLAHGTFAGAVTGMVHVKPDGSYAVEYVYHLYDYYDWQAVPPSKDLTTLIGTSQAEIGQLHDYGLAQNFVVTADSTVWSGEGKI
ncbi:hypothetical protein JVY00_03765 [Tsukamurella tyrosinosolvens]|uniref:hypothetical protein n=1 Tax=Tsukamurella tyrosinosolvens TaxID=57704 RepID=UPI001AF1376B|nr:hypothetical protein [Tsukamurella tyrosinosolvens]QRY85224.1 hypothetical protein JVY00_03765 [Tsukamurella tyrosinosolvens]